MQVRLQKFMADCGVAARRRCEELITQGQVRINGLVRDQLPVFIDPGQDEVTVGAERIKPLAPEKPVYYLLHKPKGVLVTNEDPSGRKIVRELIQGVRERLFPVGRLDMDSRGLLIMTNDGELAHQLAHPRYGVEKTYRVLVDGKMSAGAVEGLKRGMWLARRAGGPGAAVRTEGLKVRVIARDRHRTLLEVKLAEGRNRQVRRALARIGFQVRDLFRVAIAERITVKGLEPGAYRPLSTVELQWLRTVTSRDYHERQKLATQRWYERKEMEKERRRLKHVGRAT